MPNNALVILLVGHGSVSGKKAVVDVSNYNVILPTKVGDKLCLTAHNMIVHNLSSAKNFQELLYELQKLESLPSTTSVAKANIKPLPLPQALNMNLADHTNRNQLKNWLKEAETEAFDSHKAWELLEHKISPALDILSTGKAYIPTKFNPAYQEFPLLYKDFIEKAKNSQPASTLSVLINLEKVKFQINDLKTRGELQASLSNDQVIYMTPYGNEINNNKPILDLSSVLKFLPITHIVVRAVKNILSFNQQEDINIHCVCLKDYLDTPEFQQEYKGNSNPHITWYDFTIPDNCNLVLGACRDIDSSF